MKHPKMVVARRFVPGSGGMCWGGGVFQVQEGQQEHVCQWDLRQNCRQKVKGRHKPPLQVQGETQTSPQTRVSNQPDSNCYFNIPRLALTWWFLFAPAAVLTPCTFAWTELQVRRCEGHWVQQGEWQSLLRRLLFDHSWVLSIHDTSFCIHWFACSITSSCSTTVALIWLILPVNKGYFRGTTFFLLIQMNPSGAKCQPAAFQSIMPLRE